MLTLSLTLTLTSTPNPSPYPYPHPHPHPNPNPNPNLLQGLLGGGAQGTQGQPTAAQGLGSGAAPPSPSQGSADVSELPDHLLGLVLAQVTLPSYHP